MRWIPWLIVGLFAVRGIGTFPGSTPVAGRHARHHGSEATDVRQLLALPLGYFADNLSGKLISKFTFDVIQIAIA